jgi:hypothetical protein
VTENTRPPAGEDGDLRAALAALDPPVRDKLRTVLIHDQADRDAIASRSDALPRPERSGLADIIDILTMYPEERRRIVRVLGEIEERG